MTFEEYILNSNEYKLFAEEFDVSLVYTKVEDRRYELRFHSNDGIKEDSRDTIWIWRYFNNIPSNCILGPLISLTARSAYRLSEFLKFLDSINMQEVCNESY